MAAKQKTPRIVLRNRKTYNDEIHMVLVGKTGAGKSATGNIILGREAFYSEFCAKSLTVNCAKEKGEVDGQRIVVVDTPAMFDTRFTPEETDKEMKKCIKYASPGPHVFLVVIKLGRFTEEEEKTVEDIQKVFGEDAARYTMILFTHGDQLGKTPIERFLQGSEELQDLVSKCKGQYHVFNNTVQERCQVSKLLEKINKMVERKGGNHYTNQMFQEAERAIEEKKERILKKKEEERCREEEEQNDVLEEKLRKAMEEDKRPKKDSKEREKEMEKEKAQIKREYYEKEQDRRREMRNLIDVMKLYIEQARDRDRKMQKQRDRELTELKEQLDKVLNVAVPTDGSVGVVVGETVLKVKGWFK